MTNPLFFAKLAIIGVALTLVPRLRIVVATGGDDVGELVFSKDHAARDNIVAALGCGHHGGTAPAVYVPSASRGRIGRVMRIVIFWLVHFFGLSMLLGTVGLFDVNVSAFFLVTRRPVMEAFFTPMLIQP